MQKGMTNNLTKYKVRGYYTLSPLKEFRPWNCLLGGINGCSSSASLSQFKSLYA